MTDLLSRDASLPNLSVGNPGFLVLGVPRSGTTFFAEILNAHPDLLCGLERFHWHSLSPECLTEHGFRTLDLGRRSTAQTSVLLDEKAGGPHLTFGEKLPRAYLHLDAIMSRFQSAGKRLKMIVLVRDIHDIADSWYRRAADPGDQSWHRGMRGVFPFIEYVVLAWQLTRIRTPGDVMLVSYARYPDVAHRTEIMGAVAAHLGVAETGPMIEFMATKENETARALLRDRSADPLDFRSDLPFFNAFKDVVDGPGAVLLSEVQAELTRMVTHFWEQSPFSADVLDHLRAERNPDIRAYQKEVSPLYGDRLAALDGSFADRLRAAMEGSDGGQPQGHPVPTDRNAPMSIEDPTPRQVSRRYFDMTDATRFVSVHGSVTGIQRVQLDTILALAHDQTGTEDVAVFLDPDMGWVEIPMTTIAALPSDGGTLRLALGEIAAQAGSLAPARFIDGDVIYFLGATWSVSSFFESLAALRLKGVRTVFYLHDVLPLQVPEHFTAEHSDTFAHWLKCCLCSADGIICNSEETRAALLEHAAFSGPISVVDLNITPSFIDTFRSLTPEQRTAPIVPLGLVGRDYVLMVGTLEPRKNHHTALNVWSTLARRLGKACPTLVIVGKPGWMSESIIQSIKMFRYPERVIGLSEVDDRQLASLYDNALLSLSISRREGWGLPITESLALGTPCVVGTQSAAREAMQGLACIVDELSERDIVEKIEDLLTDRFKLDALRQGISRTARFKTWHDFAAELVAFRCQFNPCRTLPVPAVALNRSYTFGTNQAPGLRSAEPTGVQLRSGLGWHAPDSWGSWTRKTDAELTFQLPSSGDFVLYAVVTPTLAHERLSLAVAVDPEPAWHGTLFPNRRTLMVVGFQHPDAEHPVSARFHSGEPYDFNLDDSSADTRALGFALIELVVVEKSDLAGRLNAVERLVGAYLTH